MALAREAYARREMTTAIISVLSRFVAIQIDMHFYRL